MGRGEGTGHTCQARANSFDSYSRCFCGFPTRAMQRIWGGGKLGAAGSSGPTDPDHFFLNPSQVHALCCQESLPLLGLHRCRMEVLGTIEGEWVGQRQLGLNSYFRVGREGWKEPCHLVSDVSSTGDLPLGGEILNRFEFFLV
ncbi:DBIRD complex subunit ZNF326 [Platysternon megacephalum]|uniref:DBIRD complex subunit ZNF326 n=1 Tax=Platysternon megacephalum TaxID=55544 RepID=A0A4D9ED66_9SAUR|nr:DBIRD complex subunit ZNF326 [Platysternon megacephalum]